MTPPATTTAWAIKAANGMILKKSIRKTKEQSIAAFLKTFAGVGSVWFDWESEGYRCVRVKIEEVAE